MSQADRVGQLERPYFSLFEDLREALGYIYGKRGSARIQLTNEDMRARQQGGSYSVESAAAHTGQRPRRQEVLQRRSAKGGARKHSNTSTSAARAVAELHKNVARELLRNNAANAKSTLLPLAIPQRPTLRIND